MNDSPGQPVTKFTDVLGELIKDAPVHFNVKPEYIVITGDKLELSLRKHIECLDSKRAWLVPASLFASFLTTLCASTFNDFLFLKAAEWKALFLIATIVSVGWAVVAFIASRRLKTSLQVLMNDIRNISDAIRKENEGANKRKLVEGVQRALPSGEEKPV